MADLADFSAIRDLCLARDHPQAKSSYADQCAAYALVFHMILHELKVGVLNAG
ncbi:MAG: hypothetical protein ACT6QL_00795 [Methylophilus sp.]